MNRLGPIPPALVTKLPRYWEHGFVTPADLLRAQLDCLLEAARNALPAIDDPLIRYDLEAACDAAEEDE